MFSSGFDYNGISDSNGWYTDQRLMYSHLINYPHLKILNRPINDYKQNYIIHI